MGLQTLPYSGLKGDESWTAGLLPDQTFYTSYITGIMPQFLLLYFGKIAK